MVIAPKQKEEYDKIFHVNSSIITKGIDFECLKFMPYKINQPIKMVYTGKMLYGRDKSLMQIVAAMGKINANAQNIALEIYTTDKLTKRQKERLNRNGCQLRGALSQNEVESVQRKADVLIFVESICGKYKNLARLSFSNKITDYLKSGKCIFAVGSKDIAPIDYFIKNDSAIVASSKNEIYNKLLELLSNPDLISEYAKKAFKCGQVNHDLKKQDALLISSICEVVNG